MSGYERYAEMFSRFFGSAQMSATYKPVFVRALADIGKFEQGDLVGRRWIHRNGDRVRLDLDFVAVRLAKYYWDMEAASKMRHSPKGMADKNNPLLDIRIVELIREQERIGNGSGDDKIDGRQPGYEEREPDASYVKPPTLEELASEDMSEFRKKVVGEAMEEVLDHLLNDMPGLYELNKKERRIEFDKDLVDFMRCSEHMIKEASCHLLARKLEQLNPSTRLVATVTNSAEDIRKTLEAMSRMYTEMLPGPLCAIVGKDK